MSQAGICTQEGASGQEGRRPSYGDRCATAGAEYQRRKHSIEASIRRCERTIQSFEQCRRDNGRGTGDAADRAVAASEWMRQIEARTSAEQRLAKARHALARLCNGMGGVCEGCGHRIDSARLTAIPETTLCFDCQRRADLMPV